MTQRKKQNDIEMGTFTEELKDLLPKKEKSNSISVFKV
jgi:hypothetical protein